MRLFRKVLVALEEEISIGQVLVLGSFSVMWPLKLPRTPRLGETVIVEPNGWTPSGKGFSLALSMAQMGMLPIACGLVGNDVMGQFILRTMKSYGLNPGWVRIHPTVATGAEIPLLSPDGQFILSIPGANHCLDPSEVSTAVEKAGKIDWLVVHGDINLEATLAAVYAVKKQGGRVLLDPSPLSGVSRELLRLADIITPNLNELAKLAEIEMDGSPEQAIRGLKKLVQRLPRLTTAIATLGPQGVVVVEASESYHVPAIKVKEVDRTSVGDAFNAAFLMMMTEGYSVYQSVQKAVVASGLAVSRIGSVESLPTRAEVDGYWNTEYLSG